MLTRCDENSFAFLREKIPNTLITAFVFDEKRNFRKTLVKPYVYVSTNAADGPHYENIGHPETAGTFPRLLGKYVRELKVLALEDAVKKITLFPARRFGIRNKGEIATGKDGDLVVVDLEKSLTRRLYLNGDRNTPPVGSDMSWPWQLVFSQRKLQQHVAAGRICFLTSADQTRDMQSDDNKQISNY